LGENPLHTVLLLTEKPGAWPAWSIIPFPLAVAAVAGWLWVRLTGEVAWGWAVPVALLLLAAADAALLVALPRLGRSFGPPQPPFLALTLARGLLTMAATPLAARWPAPAAAGLALLQLSAWALMAHGTLVAPFQVAVTHVRLALPGLPNPGRPLRIAHVSDLHIERATPRDRALPALVAGLQPDLIVLTGDFLSTSYNDDPRALADLRSLLAQFSAPGGIYAVWGTFHVDLPSLLRPVLEDLGIVILEDEAREIEVRGRRLWIMGINCHQDLEVDGASLRARLAGAPPGETTLLLHHTPDLMPQAAQLRVDLYLAGHTHGGQWRLPGFGAILTSSCHGKRYEGGAYCQGRTHLYVSRGLGLEGFGTPRARFFCPPELVAVDLYSGQGGAEVDGRPVPCLGREAGLRV
jgi:predicted MPP superfamily phosphohydrolase